MSPRRKWVLLRTNKLQNMVTWGRFHEKSQTEPDSRLSQGLKSETFVSAEFLAQMDFTKGGSAETTLKFSTF